MNLPAQLITRGICPERFTVDAICVTYTVHELYPPKRACVRVPHQVIEVGFFFFFFTVDVDTVSFASAARLFLA